MDTFKEHEILNLKAIPNYFSNTIIE